MQRPSRLPARTSIQESVAFSLGLLAGNLGQNLPPSEQKRSFRIAVLGTEDPFRGELEKVLQGTKARGRAIEVLPWARDLGSLPDCDLVFLHFKEETEFAAALLSLAPKKLVTVAFFPGFLDLGGAVELRDNQQGNLGFRLNLLPLRKSGFTPSAGLLRVAIPPVLDAPGAVAAPKERSSFFQVPSPVIAGKSPALAGTSSGKRACAPSKEPPAIPSLAQPCFSFGTAHDRATLSYNNRAFCSPR